MTMQITEAKITSPKINANRELIFTLRLKKEDYDNKLWDSICDLSDNGTPLAIVMKEFQKEEEIINNIPQKRAKLAYLMQKYAEKQGTDYEELVQKFYSKYKISSRSELSEAELDEAISMYKVGLEWD